MKIIDLLSNNLPTISVGAVSANLMLLATDISLLEENHVRLLHFDVMDGHFAPQITVGPWFIKALKTKMFKDVHLMIDNPLEAIPAYAASGADCITIHAESCRHALAALQTIKAQKNANDEERTIARGIAINPSTPVNVLEPLLCEVDIVTLVCVNPGFGGQKLNRDVAMRIAHLRELIAQSGKKILLCIDGGVTLDNIEFVGELQSDIVVSGSALFENNAVARNLDFMQQALLRNRIS
jgi:ribulose-phosphate 3-epimerase